MSDEEDGSPAPARPGGAAAPFIVTLGFDGTSFQRLDQLRRAHFPPERNQVPAHLTLFHALPAVEARLIRETLQREAAATEAIALRFTGAKSLGRGVALVVDAPALGALRRRLADDFAPFLTPQDRQGFRPHVTIQNKVDPREASRLMRELGGVFAPFSGTGDALLLWRYLGGPWERVARFAFRR